MGALRQAQYTYKVSRLEDRVAALIRLGEALQHRSEYTEAVVHRASVHNSWFTKDNIHRAMESLAQEMLQESQLKPFVKNYALDDKIPAHSIGIVMAGNIPLVGFHDWLVAYLCGQHVESKLSSQDLYLLPEVVRLVESFLPDAQTTFVKKFDKYDAVIATGSNNTNRYFEYYFKGVPNIFRRSRTSIAVLDGSESDKDIIQLGDDILSYFGLGCRNVSKIFWPKGYDKNKLFELLMEYQQIMNHGKYKNNYDYNFAMWSLNREIFYTNHSLIFKEDPGYHSRIASVYFEEYEDIAVLTQNLKAKDDIQCLVSHEGSLIEGSLDFGESQRPSLLDYPDDVDVTQFILSLDS